MTRPSRPVPWTSSRLTPFSAIAFFAEGASSTSDLPDAGGSGCAAAPGAASLPLPPGAGSGAGEAAGSAFRRGSSGVVDSAGWGAAAAPSSIVASSASTPTVSPALATCSPILPATGEGTSTVTLSVSSSHSISSAATASPGCLNQLATVASVTDSPSVGTRTSTAISRLSSF